MIQAKLLQFQKMGITLKKDGDNTYVGSRYVTLNEVLAKVKKPLNDMGILIQQNPEKDGLRTILLDTEDDTKIESFMPYVETSTAQKLGSNNTYVRRYALVTMLGLEDEDDDGHKASHGPVKAPPRNIDARVPIISQDTPTTPAGLMCACGQPKKRIQTKKPGANKGRWFYSCPKPMNEQCPNSFSWESEGDFSADIEGERSVDYGPNGELL